MKFLKENIARMLLARSGKKNTPDNPSWLEQRHPSDGHRAYIDSLYFNGRDEKGAAMVARLAFRESEAPEYWLDFKLPRMGKFGLRESPGEPGKDFSLGRLQFVCDSPGKVWNLRYVGPLTHEAGTQHPAEIDWRFEGTKPIFNFQGAVHPKTLSAALASEPWDRGFFRKLRDIRTTHYEQAGKITGKIWLDGHDFPVAWRAFRDHSFGYRNWENWNRHFWFSGVLDNGECFNFTLIRYSFLGPIRTGYVSGPVGFVGVKDSAGFSTVAAEPIVPESFSVPFTTADGKSHVLEGRVEDTLPFLMGGTYRIFEGIARFSLDGVPGLGISEFGFNLQSFPDAHSVVG